MSPRRTGPGATQRMAPGVTGDWAGGGEAGPGRWRPSPPCTPATRGLFVNTRDDLQIQKLLKHHIKDTFKCKTK